MSNQHYKESLEKLKGKTVAVVYIFEGEDAVGFEHYHVWESNIISGWICALQDMHCRPLILDVRTFAEKALNKSLPYIDYVLNLNCGSCELSPMGLIPSVCAFCGIPCIPCNTVSIVSGENKHMSNLVANAIGLQTPQTLEHDSDHGIFRPLNFGSSLGVHIGKRPDTTHIPGVYQEFIPGLDITTPIVYNPCKQDFETFPTIVYLPESNDLNWFFGENAKESKQGYQRALLHSVDDGLKEIYLNLIKALSIQTFCRIDARIRCESVEEIPDILDRPLSKKDLFFIEINPMPTVGGDNSFCYSYNHIERGDNFFDCIALHRQCFGSDSPQSFLLSCSMLALQPRTEKDRIIPMT